MYLKHKKTGVTYCRYPALLETGMYEEIESLPTTEAAAPEAMETPAAPAKQAPKTRAPKGK